MPIPEPVHSKIVVTEEDLPLREIRVSKTTMLRRPTIEIIPSMIEDYLVLSLEAYVLAEDDGQPEVATQELRASFAVKIRPWWIPRFLWDKIPTKAEFQTKRVTMEVQPIWTYPRATVVPDMGPAHRSRLVRFKSH